MLFSFQSKVATVTMLFITAVESEGLRVIGKDDNVQLLPAASIGPHVARSYLGGF